MTPGRLDPCERADYGLGGGEPPAPVLTTGILDGNHSDWRRGALQIARDDGGIRAIIAKASEGKDWKDPGYRAATAQARQLGLLVGAYHFASASAPGAQQADFFLAAASVAAPRACAEPPLLLALDWETNPRRGNTMHLAEVIAFVRRVHAALGRWPVLYSGLSFLKGRLRGAPADAIDALQRCPLWLAAYGPDPLRLAPPAPWGAWSLHQYTNGGDGPADRATYPRKTPGFGPGGAPGGCDRSVFRGAAAELRAWWTAAGQAP